MRIQRPCLTCGELTTNTSRCEECAHAEARRIGRQHDKNRGTRLKDKEYDGQWRAVSQQARRIQRFCSDCGSTEDLTADHKPEAWQRKAEGKSIRLCDVDVLCRSCNGSKGSSKPGSERAHAAT